MRSMSHLINRERRFEELLRDALRLLDRWEDENPAKEPEGYGAERAGLQANYEAIIGGNYARCD